MSNPANPQCYGINELEQRSKAIQAQLRERAKRPETAQDRRNFAIWFRSCAFQVLARMRGAL